LFAVGHYDGSCDPDKGLSAKTRIDTVKVSLTGVESTHKVESLIPLFSITLQYSFVAELFMTKKEIVKSISQDLGLSKSKTREVVQKTFDAIIDALVTEGRIELRNFGIFEVKKRSARTGRNPRTGDEIMVPARCVVNFKAGKVMEERVKRLEAKSVSEAVAEAMERESELKKQTDEKSGD